MAKNYWNDGLGKKVPKVVSEMTEREQLERTEGAQNRERRNRPDSIWINAEKS